MIILKTKQKSNIQNTCKVINITGTNGKTTTAKIIEYILHKLGYKTGLASSIGIYINNKRIKKKDRTGPASYNYLYRKSHLLDFIICENVLRHIKYDHFYPQKSDICLITNISNDHLHQTKTGRITEISEIKSKLIKMNKEDGFLILNGDNKYTLNIAEKNRDKNIIFFTLNQNNIPYLRKLNPKYIYFVKGKSLLKLINKIKVEKIIYDLSKVDLTLKMSSKFNIYNIVSAICVIDNIIEIDYKSVNNILLGLNLNYHIIPGRFNIFNFKNFTVILDDAKNPYGYVNSYNSLKFFKYKRLVSVIKASSTRTPDFITKLGKIAAKHSDFIYIKESFAKDSPKIQMFGKKIAKLLMKGIKQEKRFNAKNIKTILDEEEAVKTAIKNAKIGDLILIFGYRIDKLAKLIYSLKKQERHK